MRDAPTPQALSRSLADLAAGYCHEYVGGRPDPEVGHYLAAHARRLPARVNAGDPRLSAFAAHTDPDGYVWLTGDRIAEALVAAAGGFWSFGRWLTALVDAAAATPPLPDEDLAALAAQAAALDRKAAAGWQLVSADPAGIVLRRPHEAPGG